nr:hypothetical protein Iba_chr09aCG15410 [Ipomoea batatas]
MDLNNENTAQSSTYVFDNQWSIKELQLIINHLSDQDNEALKDDTNKGKRECANLKVKVEVIEETRMIKMAEEVMVKEGLKGTSQEKLS